MARIKKKWDSLDKNIQKWATRLAAIATIIGVLTAGGGWLIHQVDNAVAARIETQTTEIQQEVQKLTEKVEENDKQSKVQLTRLELMMLMEHDPTNTVEIEKVAHHYFVDQGANSYISSLYNKWCHAYSGNCEIMYK